MNIESLSKLEATLEEYRSLKAEFDLHSDQLLETLDENSETYQSSVNAAMKDSASVSDVLHTYEGKVKTFHKQLSMEQSRDSLVPSVLDQSFRLNPSTSLPKLEKVKVPTFNGDILNFQNFRSLFEILYITITIY